MKHEFVNSRPMRIAPIRPTDIKSEIEVRGLTGNITECSVAVNITHSRTGDLKVWLRSPNGTGIQLVSNEGGRGDNFVDTVFSESSTSQIQNAGPPYTGVFQPAGNLNTLNGERPDGIWTLEITDGKWWGGGALNDWKLILETDVVEMSGPFPGDKAILLDFSMPVTPEIKRLFRRVANEWQGVINTNWLNVPEPAKTLVIEVDIMPLDGEGGILGQAGPTRLGRDMLPEKGLMQFDTADIEHMQRNGSLYAVIKHEMCHVLGFGTMWLMHDLIMRPHGADPVYTGYNAMVEYAQLLSTDRLDPIPVANTGGVGTRGAHWRESAFVNELMSGFLNAGNNPMSRMTIASLADLGYMVDYSRADEYLMPGMREQWAAMNIMSGVEKNIYLPAADMLSV